MVADITTNVAWFFLITALSGWALYGLANIRKSRAEIGSEIKLAANRKPYYDDEVLEGRRLERMQLLGVLLLLELVLVDEVLGRGRAADAQGEVAGGDVLPDCSWVVGMHGRAA
mgnify:CR=1 FL=1